MDKLNELISIIKYERDFTHYAHNVYATNRDNFVGREEERQKYLLWSGGQQEAMDNLMEKIKHLI